MGVNVGDQVTTKDGTSGNVFGVQATQDGTFVQMSAGSDWLAVDDAPAAAPVVDAKSAPAKAAPAAPAAPKTAG